MKPKIPKYPRNGFALVVTISMMVLLTILVVATLSLSSITLRSVDRDAAKAVARANAQLALTMAIGQLQKQAGPDKRVTGSAALGLANGTESLNPNWTGVWDTTSKTSEPVWLVSGDNLDPTATSLDSQNSVLFSAKPSGDSDRREIRAPYVEVDGKVLKGRYAYWTADEGTKARVDLAKPDKSPSGFPEREGFSLAQSPAEPGIVNVDETAFAAFSGDSGLGKKKKSVASMSTLSLVASQGKAPLNELPRYYLNDLTTGGYGLPVNTKDGGMKADLSFLLDTSQESKTAVQQRYFGAKIDPYTYEGQKTYQSLKSVSDGTKYFLSSRITQGGIYETGPNWGSLYSYGRLWQNVQSNAMSMVGAFPRPESDLRQDNWLPYRNFNVSSGAASFDQDPQHGNSSVTPVLSFVQITFRVKVVSQGTGSLPDNPPNGLYYVPGIEVKPVVGIWNPYNVAIKNASYLINWAIAPYFRLAHGPGGASSNDTITEVWLREYWKTAGGTLPSDSNKQGGAYFNLTTPSINLQPGEFRLFSINTPQTLADSGNSNVMVSSWGENGGFTMPVVRSYDHSDKKRLKGQQLRVPAGDDIWFGSCQLQDTQMETQAVIEWDPGSAFPGGKGTAAHFAPTVVSPNASATWLTLKSGNLHLNRYTGFWNGGINEKMGVPTTSDSTFFMPEPVRHSKYTNGDTSRSYKINNLAAGVVGHLATWRFYTRNGTEGTKSTDKATPDQSLRSWIDSNPRALASNIRFDGSRTGLGSSQGWNMVSNFTAATGDYPKVMGDRKGGSRGLIAEGKLGEGDIHPQATINGGRYQGFGGSASTTEGVNNVMIYDVPRSPLVSVGQFQHAQLSRYNYEPGFVLGNSYANPRIPTNATTVNNFASIQSLQLVDTSYDVNNRIWDSFFFSTMAPDYVGKTGSFDGAFNYESLANGTTQLPNPRMLFSPLPGDTKIDQIISSAGERAPQALAARIHIDGAFNVNSLSKEAWKAVLSTMENAEMPVISIGIAPTTNWNKPEGIRFNRFGHAVGTKGYDGTEATENDFWTGWRTLNAEQLDKLATEIVREVKERGPFRTMGDFVNRNPNSSNTAHQKKGALQAAIDNTLNAEIPAYMSVLATKPKGSQFSDAIDLEKDRTAAGNSGYLLQGDVLQSLAPILQVRSDYFRIRTCGEALDKNGKVIARAYCEAFVQRISDYVDPADRPEIAFVDLSSERNKEFGRRFQLVSFRWLSPSEI